MPDLKSDFMPIAEENIESLNLFAANFNYAVIILDLEKHFINCNIIAEKLYGYSKEEFIGKPVTIIIPEAYQKEYCEIFEKIKIGDKLSNIETTRIKKGGQLIFVEISLCPIYDVNGKITYIACISKDMTEKQYLIRMLAENEEKYKFAIENGKFGLWDWSINTSTAFYSKTWKNLLGYSEDEIENGYGEWAGRIHKDDYKYVMDSVKRHFDGEEFVVEYRLKCKSGEYKWVRTKGKIVQWDENGKPERMVGTNEDVNENVILRKKTEENENRLRAMYETMDIGAGLGEIILDDKGNPVNYKCLQMNKIMEKYIGCKMKNLTGDKTLKILPDLNRWMNMFSMAALYSKTYKFEYYKKTSKEYYNIDIYSPNPMQFAVLITDITTIKQKQLELNEKYEELQAVYEELTATEEELRENYHQLEKANLIAEKATKAKNQFLANMSHELRTPLNGILGFAQLLKLTDLDIGQKEDLSMIEQSANHLLDIINDILDITRIEAGRLELREEKFNFKEQMDYIIKCLNVLASGKDIEIMYYIEPYINNELIGDIYKLKQVLNNLISNAVKFTEHGHIYFKVKQIEKTPDEIKLQFSIEDTGKGISKEFQNEIFNIFTQEEYSYTKKYGGTGLGLAISKELVKLMKGDLWLESKVGVGSIFYFTAAFKNADNKDCNHDTKEIVYVDKNLEKDIKILVAEDNEINLKIVTAFLKQLNYNYTGTRNGEEAIKYLENNPVDIILMDIQMPVLNGYDATKIIRGKEEKTGEHKIIIAMTAYAMDGDKERFINCGMDDYISKPFDINSLNKVLSKYKVPQIN